MVKIVNFYVSQFKAKSAIESFKTLVTHHTLTKTSPSNHTNIFYEAYICRESSLGAKLPMFVHSYMGLFLRLHRVKRTVDRVQVENRLTFTTVVVP